MYREKEKEKGKEGMEIFRAPAQAKQPWQMTKEEFDANQAKKNFPKELKGVLDKRSWSDLVFGHETETKQILVQVEKYKDKLSLKQIALIDDVVKNQPAYFERTQQAPHKNIIEDALFEGKPVPPEVLKDYPDLAKVAAKALEVLTRPPKSKK